MRRSLFRNRIATSDNHINRQYLSPSIVFYVPAFYPPFLYFELLFFEVDLNKPHELPQNEGADAIHSTI